VIFRELYLVSMFCIFLEDGLVESISIYCIWQYYLITIRTHVLTFIIYGHNIV
jgi:hypothetical protein